MPHGGWKSQFYEDIIHIMFRNKEAGVLTPQETPTFMRTKYTLPNGFFEIFREGVLLLPIFLMYICVMTNYAF